MQERRTEMKKTFITIFVLSLAAVLSFAYACRTETLLDAGTDEIPLAEREVEPADTFELSGISTEPVNTDVRTGDIVWRVVDAQDRGTQVVATDFTFEAVVGKIVILEFTVQSNAQEARILYDLNLIDDRGRVYPICLPAYGLLSIEQACALQEIVPGVDYVFAAPFDVGIDSEGLILEVTDLKFPVEDYAYIDLGI